MLIIFWGLNCDVERGAGRDGGLAREWPVVPQVGNYVKFVQRYVVTRVEFADWKGHDPHIDVFLDPEPTQ